MERIFPGLEGWNKSNHRQRQTEQNNCIHTPLQNEVRIDTYTLRCIK